MSALFEGSAMPPNNVIDIVETLEVGPDEVFVYSYKGREDKFALNSKPNVRPCYPIRGPACSFWFKHSGIAEHIHDQENRLAEYELLIDQQRQEIDNLKLVRVLTWYPHMHIYFIYTFIYTTQEIRRLKATLKKHGNGGVE